MKSYLLIAFFIAISQFASAQELGRKVEIYSDTNGPQMSTIFAYDSHKLLTVTFSLWGPDLLPKQSMKTLTWSLYDVHSGKFINPWIVAVNDSSPVHYPGTMAFSWTLSLEEEVTAAIQNLRTLKLVLSVDQDLSMPVPTHFINLGSYCISNPNNFMNLTTGASGCETREGSDEGP